MTLRPLAYIAAGFIVTLAFIYAMLGMVSIYENTMADLAHYNWLVEQGQ